MHPIASAKPDSHYVTNVDGLVLDFKTGYLPTTAASRNIQMRIQALALHHEFPHLRKVRAVLAQYRFGGMADFCDYNREDLQRAEQELLFKLWQAKQPHASAVPGPHCRYCRAKGFCREVAAYSLLPVVSVPLPTKPKLTKDDIFAAVSQLQPKELLFLYERAGLLKEIGTAVSLRLKALPEDVLQDLGVRLSKASRAEIKDLAKAHGLLIDTWLTQKEFEECCKLVLGKIEEKVVPKMAEAEGITQKEAKQKLREILADAIGWEEISPRIVKLKEPSSPATEGQGS
jgi:hypothetical protein